MPIQTFSNATDDLAPENRNRGHYVAHLDPGNDGLWIPYAEGAWLQPCQFNVTTGGFTVLLKALPGTEIGVHYHVGTVRGYTIKGHWRYLEHDWIAKPGTFIYEPAGEAHTLVVLEDSPEPALIYFAVEGALVYLDKPVDGSMAAYEDGFSLLEHCRNYYREAGMDLGELDARIR